MGPQPDVQLCREWEVPLVQLRPAKLRVVHFRDRSGRVVDQFEGRIEFVVTRDFERAGTGLSTLKYTRLHLRLCSATDRAPGVGRYRAVYSGPDDEYRVLTVVPGATLVGTADGPHLASTPVSIAGTDFEYARRVEPGDDGSFAVIVAHPGAYRLGDRRVGVTETDVLEGHTVSVEYL